MDSRCVLGVQYSLLNGATGFIDFESFKDIMTEKYAAQDPAEELHKAFRLFDEDGSGVISFRNLKRVAKELGEKLSDDELQAMIDEFDRDHDGLINESEFASIMKQTSLY